MALIIYIVLLVNAISRLYSCALFDKICMYHIYRDVSAFLWFMLMEYDQIFLEQKNIYTVNIVKSFACIFTM